MRKKLVNMYKSIRVMPGIKAFINCTSLKQISIPSLVEYIEEETFKNCQSLTDVTFAAVLCYAVMSDS